MKATTAPYKMLPTFSKTYRTVDKIVRTEMLKTEIGNEIQATGHDIYT
jgi:hypothetical protein